MIRIFLMACVLAALSGGCALTGTFADMSNVQTTMRGVKLESGNMLKLAHGGSVERIPLSILRSITLHYYESRTIDRELYVLCDLELRDGSVMSADKDPELGTFMCVNNAFIGKADKSCVRVPLDKISRISFK